MRGKTVFVDTNILVYAYDNSEPKKQEKCRKLLGDCFSGKANLMVSNQVLAEFCSVVTGKIQKPLEKKEAGEILEEIIETGNFLVANYNAETVRKANSSETPFWNSLIAETMKENGVFEIYTENTKDFSGIKEITAVNPLK